MKNLLFLIAFGLLTLQSCFSPAGITKTVAKGEILVPDSVRNQRQAIVIDTFIDEDGLEKNVYLEIDQPNWIVLVKDIDPETNKSFWTRWEAWEWTNKYNLEVWTNDKIEAIFIDPCSSEVYATLTVYGTYSKQRIKKSIKLDGGDYVFNEPSED